MKREKCLHHNFIWTLNAFLWECLRKLFDTNEHINLPFKGEDEYRMHLIFFGFIYYVTQMLSMAWHYKHTHSHTKVYHLYSDWMSLLFVHDISYNKPRLYKSITHFYTRFQDKVSWIADEIAQERWRLKR